ncbi:hypothetical protein [Streptoalloteichus hindustanus]|uniref:Uncharacterized protein n=1 Tax=Streptoalloteichus hindustanus TaxID=2017 RepID=A0A1M5D793_STRHI|nr:hypothetical protein [Streptoalloteichus hindustanus]SHF62542.1 hypothetical protein SAMN05444320_104318 [Streptoalloteichus hindustanus]
MRSRRVMAVIATALAVGAGTVVTGAGAASASPSPTPHPATASASEQADVQLARGYQGPFGTREQCDGENRRWAQTHRVNECFYWGGSGSPRGWYFYVFGPR